MDWTSPWLLALVAAVMGAYLASYVVLKEAREKSAAQTTALQARMRYQQASVSPCTTIENVTCGWINILFKYMWPGFVSTIANNLAQRQLGTLFEKLSASLKDKPVFRMAFAKMSLRELCLGCLPPEFDNATARIMPKEMAMEIELDVNWRTCGFHFIVDCLVDVSDRKWNAKVTMHDLTLQGRMLFVLKLSKTLLPGIEGFQFSFVRKPHLMFDINLKGLMFSEVPGLVGELRRRLVTIIAAEAVEPARVWINLKTPFYNLKTRKESGRRGQLKIVVQRCTDLKPTVEKGSSESQHDAEEVMCFIEMQTLGIAYVSPVAAQGSAPEFDWAFYVPVDSVPTVEGAVSVRFILRNFLARKQPQILGEGILQLDSFSHDQLTRAEPHPARLRAKSPKGQSGGGGALHLLLSYHAEPPRLSSSSQPEPPPSTSRPNGGKAVGPQGDHGKRPRQGNLQTLPEGEEGGEAGGDSGDESSEGSRRGRDRGRWDNSAANQAENASRASSATGGNNGAQSCDADAASAQSHGGWRGRNDLATLTAATRSDFNLENDTRTHALSSAKRRARELEQLLHTEMERRHEEELRALLEGAPFIMHRGRDKLMRHVWVADVPEKRIAVLRWQSNKGKHWRKVAPGGDHVKFAKEQYHEAAVGLLTSVTYGHDLFPEVHANRHKGRSVGQTLSHDKCFSILLKVRAEASDALTVAIHLEVPPYGNGRSRSEWVSAFNSLMCRKLPIYKLESPPVAFADDNEGDNDDGGSN